jgi:CRP-like cAMP-binding protein
MHFQATQLLERASQMPTSLFARRIRGTIGLSIEDHEALRSLRLVERSIGHREFICREGDVATRCTLLIDGFIARYRVVGDREQILSFHVAGDFPDLQTLQLPIHDHNVVSIGPSRIGQIALGELQEILDEFPKLAHAFWRETLIEAAIFRQWVCNVAARDALGSISHLLCELAVRLDAVGLVKDDSFRLPLTQQDIANATGVSTVHVNRILQDLRNRKLIRWESRTITLVDFERLKRVADFDPGYLHLQPRLSSL